MTLTRNNILGACVAGFAVVGGGAAAYKAITTMPKSSTETSIDPSCAEHVIARNYLEAGTAVMTGERTHAPSDAEIQAEAQEIIQKECKVARGWSFSFQ